MDESRKRWTNLAVTTVKDDFYHVLGNDFYHFLGSSSNWEGVPNSKVTHRVGAKLLREWEVLPDELRVAAVAGACAWLRGSAEWDMGSVLPPENKKTHSIVKIIMSSIIHHTSRSDRDFPVFQGYSRGYYKKVDNTYAFRTIDVMKARAYPTSWMTSGKPIIIIFYHNIAWDFTNKTTQKDVLYHDLKLNLL